MAVIISGGDGPTPRLPGPPAKAMRAARSTSARGMAAANAIRPQPAGTIVSGGDTPKPQKPPRMPKGATIISGGG